METAKKKLPKYSQEVRERAVRMVFEHQHEHESQWSALASIASKIGCTAETLRNWVRQKERDQGERPGPTSAERERIKVLEHLLHACSATSRSGSRTGAGAARRRTE